MYIYTYIIFICVCEEDKLYIYIYVSFYIHKISTRTSSLRIKALSVDKSVSALYARTGLAFKLHFAGKCRWEGRGCSAVFCIEVKGGCLWFLNRFLQKTASRAGREKVAQPSARLPILPFQLKPKHHI